MPTTPAAEQERLLWWRWATLIIFPLHLLITHLTYGLRTEHLVMDAAFVGLAWLGPRLRVLSWRCVPFGLTAVAYDNQRYFTHLRGKVHVADLWHSDARWFGWTGPTGRKLPLTEYFRNNTTPALDFLCGLAYAIYIVEAIGLLFYLYFKDERRMGHLAWGFLLINLMGMVTYLVYPAAPPWYVEDYGLGPAQLDAAPSAAGTLAFDAMLGINYFKNFYSRNTNVFGAMPSLHVGYPTLVLCVVATMGMPWAVSTAIFALWVAFSAIYLRHHYVWDVIFGALYAVLAHCMVLLVQRLRRRAAEVSDQETITT